MSEGYYEILQIPRTATEDDIRKGYRKQALKWHPDKNPENKDTAEARFKLIAEAYEVLSNKDKRAIYDRYGKDGLSGSSRNETGEYAATFETCSSHDFRSPEDVFREFFGTNSFGDIFNIAFQSFGTFHDFGGRNGAARRRHREADFVEQDVSGEDFANFLAQDWWPSFDDDPVREFSGYAPRNRRQRRSHHRSRRHRPQSHFETHFYDPFSDFGDINRVFDHFADMEQYMMSTMERVFGRF